MKISKRDAKLLLILMGVVVFLLSYLLVYNRYIDKRDQLAEQISQLQPQLNTLEGYYANLATYQSAVADDKKTVQEEMAKFPAQVRTENLVLYAVELRTRLGIAPLAMTFTDPVRIGEFNGVAGSGGKETTVKMDAYQIGMNLSGDLTYPQLKQMLHYIYSETPEYTSVNSLSVSYDAQKAKITGTVGISKFYITYPNIQSGAQIMPSVPMGRSNLFGSLESAD